MSNEKRGRRTQQVTLREVAQAAGVSMMTVSNVIHDRVNVSDSLRERIRKHIAELGYVPNRAAQELAGQARPHFGLLYPSTTNPFIAAVIVGAMQAAARLRIDVSVHLAQLDHPRTLKTTLQRMQETGVNGLLLPSPIAEFVATTVKGKGLTVPAVAIAPGFPVGGMASVRADERQASIELVSILIAAGHRRIGHLAGPETQSGSIARVEGYHEALQAHGIASLPTDIVRSDSFRFQDGLVAAERLFESAPDLTAVFAANDTLAAAVLGVAQRRGIAIPAELSVVGYDDSPVAEQVWPGLTTIHQDARAMTEKAVEILDKGVRAWRKDPTSRLDQDVLFPYQVVTRASVAPPKRRRKAPARDGTP